MTRYLATGIAALGLLAAGLGADGAPSEREAWTEVRKVAARAPNCRPINLPTQARELVLTVEQSLTVENLRGALLDPAPPELGALAEAYDPNQTDNFQPGQAPYVAPGIQPFRFSYFNCEFNYGGWHNMAMQEYAATHGFNIIYPYVRKASQRSRLPAGTKWLKWGGFINWDEWLPKHDLPAGRYDKLADLDVFGELVQSKFLGDDDPADWDYLMIDMEHSVLQPEDLRKQEWYPKDATGEEKQDFERKYYQGYALTYIAPMAAAKELGYKNLSVYGWEPFPRTWWGLDKLQFDPATYPPWQLYGRSICRNPATDLLNPSLYVFYWSPQNVASTICNLDYNRQLVETEDQAKPLRPYYWTLLHGGDANYHWWSNQPVPNEEARAWTLFAFMSGVDGFDLWNWSGTGSHHVPRPLKYQEQEEWKTSDVGVKERFTCPPVGGGPEMEFARYDFIHVLDVDDATGRVRFQKVDRYNWGAQYGLTPDKPVYALKQTELVRHLRAESEPVAGVVEGMALAKCFEYTLRHGEVKVDVASLDQFLQTLPIVRRVQLGRYHLIATYDPRVVHGGAPREIALQDFAGLAGLTLRLPADSQARIWVLVGPAPPAEELPPAENEEETEE